MINFLENLLYLARTNCLKNFSLRFTSAQVFGLLSSTNTSGHLSKVVIVSYFSDCQIVRVKSLLISRKNYNEKIEKHW